MTAAGGCAAVLKLGGSVLVGDAGWTAGVACVRREREAGRDVLLVVSATGGTTESLLAAARARSPRPSERSLAQLLRSGEEVSVALMVMALEAEGIAAVGGDAAWLGLAVAGSRLDARPVGVDRGRLADALSRVGVLVVPGFVGCHVDGGPGLLGRGGSDMTAVFLAARLGVPCRLVKDVDGLFETDPRAGGPPPRRYARAAWETALGRGAVLIQPKATELARELGVELHVGGTSGLGTVIGPGPDLLDPEPQEVRA